MATPIYKGPGQPLASSGWLSGFGSWFGGGSPAYAGAGQPAPSSSGSFGGSTPPYKTAPSSSQAVTPSTQGERITIVVPRELIEPQQ